MKSRYSAQPAGFTLVELALTTVVLAIVLAWLVATGQYVRNQGMTRFTRDVLAQVNAALAEYHAAYDAFPPDRFARGSGGATASHQPQTEGIECLVLALGARADRFWDEPRFQRARGNVDADYDRSDPAKPRPLWELIDGWGRPLLYYNGYGAGPKGPPGALPPFAGYAESRVRQLNKSLGERWIQNDRRPLVDSAGPDGEWNDSDDVQMVEDKSLEPSAGE